MTKYDPNKAPDPTQWLDLDEQERVSLVAGYHNAAKIRLPNTNIHSAFHTVVENQIAEGVPSTVQAMGRLMKEGLTRHDALHAVAAVIVEHLSNLMKEGGPALANLSQARLDAALEKTSAKEWRRKFPA